jgi:hypothetical protein
VLCGDLESRVYRLTRRLIPPRHRCWSRLTSFAVTACAALFWGYCMALFFWSHEGWRWEDAVYFVVVTLTTVGFGDFAPSSATLGSSLIYATVTLIVLGIVLMGMTISSGSRMMLCRGGGDGYEGGPGGARTLSRTGSLRKLDHAQQPKQLAVHRPARAATLSDAGGGGRRGPLGWCKQHTPALKLAAGSVLLFAYMAVGGTVMRLLEGGQRLTDVMSASGLENITSAFDPAGGAVAAALAAKVGDAASFDAQGVLGAGQELSDLLTASNVCPPPPPNPPGWDDLIAASMFCFTTIR